MKFGSLVASAQFVLFLICLACISLVNPAFAESSQDNSSNTKPTPAQKAYATALKAATKGPASVPLLDQGTLNLPDKYLFFPTKEAAALLRANGNFTINTSELVGLIIPAQKDIEWLVVVEFIKSGYLRDDDAKKWTSADLLNRIKSGTNADNKERVAHGIPELEVLGWQEPPNYNATTHQLIWSLMVKDKDSDSESLVNYNTFILGKEGYFKLDLLTLNSSIESYKPVAHKILDSLHYTNGKRYEDFVEGRDRVATYGLAALITGIAAKKLGLFALAGVFFLKIWKFIIIVPLLFWKYIKRIFKKN